MNLFVIYKIQNDKICDILIDPYKYSLPPSEHSKKRTKDIQL